MIEDLHSWPRGLRGSETSEGKELKAVEMDLLKHRETNLTSRLELQEENAKKQTKHLQKEKQQESALSHLF